jgi:hypothetical protein
MDETGSSIPGSARASRAGDDALVIADFFFPSHPVPLRPLEVRFGVAPKPGRRGDRSPECRFTALSI